MIMNSVYLQQNSLAKSRRQDAYVLTSSTTLLETSTGRYIQRLEEEVRELTQQYECVCGLLYQAVIMQDVLTITAEECETRRRVIEGEAKTHGELMWLFFHITTMQKQVESTVVSLRGGNIALLQNELMMTHSELPDRITKALCESLHKANEHFLQLLEIVPERVCSALTATEATVLPLSLRSKDTAQTDSIDNNSSVVQQRLERIMTGVDELVKCVCHQQTANAGEVQSKPLSEGYITALQNTVKSLDESSRRLVDVLHLHEVSTVLQPSTQKLQQSSSPPSSPPSLPCLPPKDLQVSVMLPRLTQRAVATLESLMAEYIFMSEQMQMVAEQEMSISWLAHDQRYLMRLNSLADEKAFEIQRLQCEVDRLKSQAVANNSTCDTQAAVECTREEGVAKTNMLPSLARFYAEFAAPFIPPNVRHLSFTKLQPIAKLREEALRVGARPVSPLLPSTRAATATRQSKNAALPESDTCKSVSSSLETPCVAKKNVRESGGMLCEKQHSVCFMAPRKTTAAAAVTSPAALTEGVAMTITTTGASPIRTNSQTQRLSGKGEGAVGNVIVRKFQKDTTSDPTTNSDKTSTVRSTFVSTPANVSKTQNELYGDSLPLVKRSSFDESSGSLPVVPLRTSNAQRSKKSSAGDFLFADSLNKNEKTDVLQGGNNESVASSSSSSLSATSLTLTLDSSHGEGGKAPLAVAGNPARTPNRALSFEREETKLENPVRKSWKKTTGDNPSTDTSKLLSGLKSLPLLSY